MVGITAKTYAGKGRLGPPRKKPVVEEPEIREPEIEEPIVPPQRRGEYLTAQQAKEQYDIDLDPGWQLRIATDPQIGTQAFQVSPEGWEIDRYGGVKSPEGKYWTAYEYERELGGPQLAPSELLERESLERTLGEVFPEGDVATLFQQMSVTPDMPEEERILAEQAQDEFLEDILAQGRTGATVTLLKQLGVEEADIDLFFGPTVMPERPLHEMPVGFYRLEDQPLDKLREFATQDGQGLRHAILSEGRSETTENLVRQIYGAENITDKYLNDYFLDNIGGKFARGEWLPDPLEDYWKLYAAGVGDLVEGVAGLADRVGAEAVSDSLKNIALEGRLVAADVEMAKPDTPAWYAQNMARMVPFILSIIAPALGAAGGAMAVARAAGAGTFTTRMVGTISAGVTSAVSEGVIEAGHGYFEAERRGFSKAEQNAVFDQILRENVALLSGTNTAQFGAAFMLPGGATANLIVKGLLFGFAAVSEGVEEGGQLFITRRALDDPVLVFDEEFWQNFKLGMAGGLLFQSVGSVYSSVQNRTKDKLSVEQRKVLDLDVAEGMLGGLSRQEAESRALDKFAETPEGESIIIEAVEEIMAEEKAKAISDIPKIVGSIQPLVDKVQPTSERADKLAKEQIEEIPAVPEVVPEATLSLDEISKYETRIPLDLIRKDEKASLERLTTEIEKEGITEPITIRVREDGSRIVWDGMHRLIVAQNLGIQNVPVKFIGEVAPPVTPVQIPLAEKIEVPPTKVEIEEASVRVRELEGEIAGMKETLATDTVATTRFTIGKKSVDLTHFISLREGTFPDYFTLKEAQALYPEHVFEGYTQKGTPQYNRVPRDAALDDLTKKLGMSPDEIADRVMAIRTERARIKELEAELAGIEVPVAPKVVKPPAPKVPITADLKTLVSDIKTEVEAAQAAVKGLTGEEAKVARETLKGLERELKYAETTLENFIAKPELPDATVLRSTIMARARFMGLPKIQLQSIYSDVAGRRQLRVIPQAQLVQILEKVKKARPKRIGGRTVITPKTETKIQTLRDTLIRNKQLTQKSFDHLVSQLRLLATGYESQFRFITEGEGKTLIRVMNDEAVLAQWDIAVEESLEKNPDIKAARDVANTRSVKTREVTFDEAPIRIKRGNELRSMRYYVLKLQKELSTPTETVPIYDIWQKINMAHLAMRQNQRFLINRLEASTPEFKAIIKSEEAMMRVEDYIAAKHKMGPKSPKNITADEISLANELEKQLFEFRDDVRYARFTEAYAGHSGEVDMIARDIPDANKRALRRATDTYEGKGATELRKFLDTQDWGVIKTGYDPRSIVKPRLHLYEAKATTFAKGHIQTRRGVEYATEDRTIIQRYRSYSKQMMGLTDLAPLIRAFDRVFTEHAYKLENYRPVAKVLSRGLNEMKGYREDGGFLIHMMERMYAQVASAVFWRPDLVLRNKFQNFAFNPDYHAGLFLRPRKALTAARRLWFETFVSQEKGMTQDYLLYSEVPLRGFGRVTNIAHKTSLYPWSDKSNRTECFQVRIDRVDRALEGYKKDGDVNKLIKNSGMLEFEARQQAEALELLAMDKVDYGVEGMPAVTGLEAFALYNAQQLTNNVHFLYDRAQRAPAEMGASGKTLGNILVFSRSWGERLVLQVNKVTDPKASMRERILAMRIVVGIILSGLLAGEGYKKLTGKTHNPYNPLNILTWTPGGLIVGVTEDIANVIYWMTRAAQGDERALGVLPGLLRTAATLTLPFYKNLVQVIDSLTDMKDIDVWAMRKMREMVDEEYEVRGGVHEVERTLVEKFQHAILAGKDKPETPQEKAADVEEMVGQTIEEEDMPFSIEEPDIYDMSKLNSDYGRILKDIKPEDVTKENDYSAKAIGWVEKEANEAEWKTYPNVALYKINADSKEGDTFEEFYRQWRLPEEQRADYDKAYLGNFSQRQLSLLRKYHALDEVDQPAFLEKHPELKVNLRDEWLKENPLANARLAVWGQAKILSQEAYDEVQRLIKVLDIPDDAIPEFTMPPEESVETHFKYLDTGEEFGWNSWETQLVLAQDDAYREWRGLDPVETPVASLELKVKHRGLFDTISGYGDKDSPLYIEDDDARDKAREKLRVDNPEWVDDIRRIEAIDLGAPDKIIESWVERGKLVDEFNAGSSEAMVWLVDHKETWDWALEQELLTDDGSDWNVPVLRINAKWREEDDFYDAIPVEGDVREKYLAEHEEYRQDRRRRDAYELETPAGEKFPEREIENYVDYYELPIKGFKQERFLVENEGFANAMHTVAGIDLPDPAKVPAVQYDELYEKWQEDFDKLAGLSDHESPHYIEDTDKRDEARQAMRLDERGNLTEFGEAELEREAYGKFFPKEYVEKYVEYYTMDLEGKPSTWPEDETWYEPLWFLEDNRKFYNIAKELLDWEPKDFSNIPSQRVWALYLVYIGLPLGQIRKDYRAQHTTLDRWLVKAKGLEPIGDRGDVEADISRAEQLAIDIAKGLERIEKLRE